MTPMETAKSNPNDRLFLTKFAWLSIGAAILTIALKTTAYILTGSVGLLSDALESIVNLVGAVMALAMLTIAARPADEDHAYGHTKAEYFSSGVEGTVNLSCLGFLGVGTVGCEGAVDAASDFGCSAEGLGVFACAFEFGGFVPTVTAEPIFLFDVFVIN